ncbi:MAG: class I SAM-dependent methyltransferase [Elainellaceae cyanobacterium]
MTSLLFNPLSGQNKTQRWRNNSLIQQLARQDIQVLTESEADTSRNLWDIVCQDGQENTVLHQFKTFKTLGLGNTYVKGLWRCDRLDLLLRRLFDLDDENKANSILFEMPNSPALIFEQILYKFFNISLIRQNDVAKKHYDLPAELYEGFLEETMKYTTGLWTGIERTPENLTSAQIQCLDYWAQEMQLKDGDIVLDCGCGWGTLPKYLQDRFNLTYIGFTISSAQVSYCKSQFSGVENYFFYNHSYHDSHSEILAQSGVDHITKCIFLETIEHGGIRNWPNILKNVRKIMPQDGILAIQTIGTDHPVVICDPYINRYILHHLSLGAPSEIGKALESDRQFVIQKQQNIADSYATTLQAWNHYFQKNWLKIQPYIADIIGSTPFDTTEEWKRNWEFYLMLSQGAYAAGTYVQLYQLTAKPNFYA